MPNLVKKIQNVIFQQSLFERGAKIVLGVSGGPDSVAMLDIFARLQKKYDLSLIIAHVNYGLRGKDSDKDEKFVRELAKKYGFDIFVLHPAKTNSSENALRNIRYEFFEKIRQENKSDLIAVAHNADDQVETFLMRVIRGSGLQGLTAMQFKNNKIIRPLLSTPRAEILNYLTENKLKYRTDKTNLESKFLRNKIRNKLLPLLEREYNPNIRKTIFHAVQNIANDYDLISFCEKSALKKSKKALSVSELLKLHPALQRRLLRAEILKNKADLKNIDAVHVEEILRALRSTKNKAQTVVFEGLKITKRGDKLEFSKSN